MASNSKTISPLQADFFLLLVALSWGATFIIVKIAITDLPPFPFLTLRFGIAFLVLLPLLWVQRRYIHPKAIAKGFLLGFFVFLGYATQTIGLQYTSASNAGFITGLNVVIVPLLVAVYQRTFPSKAILTGTSFAAAGLAMLSIGDGFSINQGDPIVLICAFSFAAQIVLTERFAVQEDASVLTTFQLLLVTLLSGLLTLATPQPPILFTSYALFGVLLTALLCTAAAFLLQTKMQQFTSASHTAIIFTAEPVFAAIFAYLIAGELLSLRGYLGAGLVLLGILVAEWKGQNKNPVA